MLQVRLIVIFGLMGMLFNSCNSPETEEDCSIENIELIGDWEVGKIEIEENEDVLKEFLQMNNVDYDVFMDITRDGYENRVYSFGDNNEVSMTVSSIYADDFESAYSLNREEGTVLMNNIESGIEVEGCSSIVIIEESFQDKMITVKLYCKRVQE